MELVHPNMTTGFQNESLNVQTKDGLDDALLEPLVFVDPNGNWWEAPTGSTTDGLSTPPIVRILPGYDATGDDWWSGVLHDSGYRRFIRLRQADGSWRTMALTQKQCDTLILQAMTSQGVGFLRRHIIYFALRLFGSFAFKGDRIEAAKRPDVTTGGLN